MSNWYHRVTGDLTELPLCIEHFEEELLEARRELSMKNKTLEKHGSELPGLVEMRFSQLQEVEAILEYLNIELRKTRSAKFKQYLENYNRQLSSRDVEKYVDGEADVVDLAVLVNEVALLRNKFLSVTKGLDQKSWMIGHITRLRVAGLDDARLD